MPGDTLISKLVADTLSLADSLSTNAQPAVDHPSAGEIGFGLMSFAAIGILILTVILGKRLGDRLRLINRVRDIREDFQGRHAEYDAALDEANPYYASLPPTSRERFLARLTAFMASKQFHYEGIEPDDKIPMLISAAAVQLCFGLDKFLLNFFENIYVLDHEYMYGDNPKPFEGHVSNNGIYLSWNNFQSGYANYRDASNLGLHEMAHALAYANFMADDHAGQDAAFIDGFHAFSAVARPIFNQMQDGATNMLDSYGATNYNEFWAVSVEAFFEKPQEMKMQMPELYAAQCVLLNQDPLLAEKIMYA